MFTAHRSLCWNKLSEDTQIDYQHTAHSSRHTLLRHCVLFITHCSLFTAHCSLWRLWLIPLAVLRSGKGVLVVWCVVQAK